MYSVTGKWTILPGNEEKATAALANLAKQVEENEPGTLLYMVNVPDFSEKSVPTPPVGEITFWEIYEDKAAFQKHLTGPYYQGFVKEYGSLFLSGLSEPPAIFMTAEILTRIGGFARSGL